MKKINEKNYWLNLILFLCVIISCAKDKESIEERIESHKINTYSLGDSLKNIDIKIDSLIKAYSNKQY